MPRRLSFCLGTWASLFHYVNACLPPLETPIGPRVGVSSILSIPNVEVLFTSQSNPNLLGAEVTNFGEDGRIEETFQIVIDLRDGSVSAGSIPDPTTPSPQLNDPTGGYELKLNGRKATLSSGDRTYEVTLFSPMAGDVSMNFLYFFVSQKLQRAYLFYVVEIDCRVPGVVFSGCQDCPTCVLEQNYVSILNLASVRAIVRVFDYTLGLGLDNPGPFNSLQVVYDDLQFAMLGPTLCGFTPFLFFDETTAEESSFQPWYLSAIVPGFTSPRQATAYRPNTQEVTVDSGGNKPYSIAQTMVIQEVRLVDSTVVRTIDVDMERIRQLAGFDITRFIAPPPDQAPVQSPLPPPPVVALPIAPVPNPATVPVPIFDGPSIPTIRIVNPALPTAPAAPPRSVPIPPPVSPIVPKPVPVPPPKPAPVPPPVPSPQNTPISPPIVVPPIAPTPAVPSPRNRPVAPTMPTRAPFPTVRIPYLGPKSPVTAPSTPSLTMVNTRDELASGINYYDRCHWFVAVLWSSTLLLLVVG